MFILGLDGLEYNWVEQWTLNNLKQLQYGKLEVPIHPHGIPFTPEVWASFLTGKTQRIDWEYGTVGKHIRSIIQFFRRHLNVSLGLDNRFIKRRYPKLDEQTFLDFVANSKTFNAPYYTYDFAIFSLLSLWARRKISHEKLIQKLYELYGKQKRQMVKFIHDSQEFELLFAYLHFPDALNHTLWKKSDEIKNHYRDLDTFFGQIKSLVNNGNTLFLIISDHGFDAETGTHSTYGFYSSSRVLNPAPTKITDFFQIILDGNRSN